MSDVASGCNGGSDVSALSSTLAEDPGPVMGSEGDVVDDSGSPFAGARELARLRAPVRRRGVAKAALLGGSYRISSLTRSKTNQVCS